MKKFTKLLSATLAATMLVSSIGMVASAVTITAPDYVVDVTNDTDAYAWPTGVSNFYGANTDASLTGNTDLANAPTGVLSDTTSDVMCDAVGYPVTGEIKFQFDEEMDVDTLIPENITITPVGISSGAGENYGRVNDTPNDRGFLDSNFNATEKTVKYTPLRKSATEYVIWLGDLAPGLGFIVKFTSNVKSASGTAITETKFKIGTRLIARMPYREGKKIVEIGYNKPTYDQDGSLVLSKHASWNGVNITGHIADYSGSFGSQSIEAGNWWKVDLGNIYEVGDIAIYDGNDTWRQNNQKIEIYYSSDPNSGFNTDQTAPTYWGDMNAANRPSNYANGSLNKWGTNGDRWLNPESGDKTARYIFLKNAGSGSADIQGVEVFGYVDNYYTTITAEKDGAAVTECTGAGTYTFKAPVLDFVGAKDASGYMIVAGYDSNGVTTAIKCEPVSYTDGYFTLEAAMPDDTVSIKASLIEDFTSPYLVTDALELPAATSAQ